MKSWFPVYNTLVASVEAVGAVGEGSAEVFSPLVVFPETETDSHLL